MAAGYKTSTLTLLEYFQLDMQLKYRLKVSAFKRAIPIVLTQIACKALPSSYGYMIRRAKPKPLEGYEPNDAGVTHSQYNGSDQSWYIVLGLSDQHIQHTHLHGARETRFTPLFL